MYHVISISINPQFCLIVTSLFPGRRWGTSAPKMTSWCSSRPTRSPLRREAPWIDDQVVIPFFITTIHEVLHPILNHPLNHIYSPLRSILFTILHHSSPLSTIIHHHSPLSTIINHHSPVNIHSPWLPHGRLRGPGQGAREWHPGEDRGRGPFPALRSPMDIRGFSFFGFLPSTHGDMVILYTGRTKVALVELPTVNPAWFRLVHTLSS